MAKTPLELGTLARSYCQTAIECARGIMNDTTTPKNIRIMAANILLDRGLGKAAQAVTVDMQVQVKSIERIIVDPLIIEHEPDKLIESDT